MVRILLLVAFLILATGCIRVLEPIPGFEKMVSGVIVGSTEDSVKIEAAWTVSKETIRRKAEEGCEAQSSEAEAKKKPTKEVGNSCVGIFCLTTLHLFYCKTDAEMEILKTIGAKIAS